MTTSVQMGVLVVSKAARTSDVGTIAVSAMCICLVFYDSSVVSVALPRIQVDLHIGASAGAWVTGAFLIVLTVLVVPAGRFVQTHDPRKVMLGGTMLFLVGTIGAGTSATAPQLFISRGIQGAAAAVLLAGGTLIIARGFPPKRRGMALGVSLAVGSIALAAGPVIGGLLTGGPGWRWIFLTTVIPIVILLVLIGAFAPSRGGVDEQAPRSLDIAGVALLAIAITGFVVGLVQFGSAQHSLPLVVSCFVAAIVFGLAFVMYESKARFPLIDVGWVAGHREMQALLLALLFSRAGILGAATYTAVYFELGLSETPIQAGISLLPAIAPVFLAAPISGVLADRIGSVKVLAVSGLALAVGLTLIVPAIQLDSFGLMVCALILLGAGAAAMQAPMTAACLNLAPTSELGMVIGLVKLVGQAGGLIGIAIFAAGIGYLGTLVAHTDHLIPLYPNQKLSAEQRSGLDVGVQFGAAFFALAIILSLVLVWRNRHAIDAAQAPADDDGEHSPVSAG